MEISKELFFAVKEFEEFNFDYSYDTKNEEMETGLEYFYFRCKGWASGQGYPIESYTFFNTETKKNEGYAKVGKYCFPIDTELESVFKACQWILDNKIKG